MSKTQDEMDREAAEKSWALWDGQDGNLQTEEIPREDVYDVGFLAGIAYGRENPVANEQEPDTIQVPRELWEELKLLWKQVPGKGTKQSAEALNLIEKAGL